MQWPVNRFAKIKSYIYFTNNNSQCQTNTEKYWKIHSVIDALYQYFQLASLGEHLAVDKVIVPFKFLLFVKTFFVKWYVVWVRFRYIIIFACG